MKRTRRPSPGQVRVADDEDDGEPVGGSPSVEAQLARPAVRSSHIHFTGPRRGRWCPGPGERSIRWNLAILDPGSDGSEGAWACRWRDRTTGRHNYLLRSPADDNQQARLFDAAARLGDNLEQVRAVIAEDACNPRSTFYREAVKALETDQAHLDPGSPEGTLVSAYVVGDPTLVKAVVRCPKKRQPSEEAVKRYLEQVQGGLTPEAFHYFQAVRFALPAVQRLRKYLSRRNLAPRAAVLLLAGFRVGDSDDPLLRHARTLGCPEATFPTKSGRVHLCGGVVGAVAARLWKTIPVTTLVGPASLYAELLDEVGARATAEWMVQTLPRNVREGPLAVCEVDPTRHDGLHRGVLPAEAAANDWFWEQKRRPTSGEEALVSGLVRLAAVPLAQSVAREGLTLRAASRCNKEIHPEPISSGTACNLFGEPLALLSPAQARSVTSVTCVRELQRPPTELERGP